ILGESLSAKGNYQINGTMETRSLKLVWVSGLILVSSSGLLDYGNLCLGYGSCFDNGDVGCGLVDDGICSNLLEDVAECLGVLGFIGGCSSLLLENVPDFGRESRLPRCLRHDLLRDIQLIVDVYVFHLVLSYSTLRNYSTLSGYSILSFDRRLSFRNLCRLLISGLLVARESGAHRAVEGAPSRHFLLFLLFGLVLHGDLLDLALFLLLLLSLILLFFNLLNRLLHLLYDCVLRLLH
ncbi:hypothetical protein PMAYCL1PPCAC_01128, partial [Pristionchus mayeri]